MASLQPSAATSSAVPSPARPAMERLNLDDRDLDRPPTPRALLEGPLVEVVSLRDLGGVAAGPEVMDDSNLIEPSRNAHEAMEKLNRRVSLCFGSAILSVVFSSYFVSRALRERSFSLWLPFWTIVAAVIGTVGLILQKMAKTEIPRALDNDDHKIQYQKGQPVPIHNPSRDGFVNAPVQAFMNDPKYPGVLKLICEGAKRRHKAFENFLELFPSPSYLPASVSRLLIWLRPKKNEVFSPLAIENMRDVLAMLMPRKSSLKYDTPGFQQKYPHIYRVLGEFSKARKEADFETVRLDEVELNREFSSMKEDPAILTFFNAERQRMAKELSGFDAFLNLIQAYETAVKREPHYVNFVRWLSSPIGNVRNLMYTSGDNGEEDVEEFVQSLRTYVRPDDYPEAFFPVADERMWAKCPEEEQNQQELAARWEKHQNGDLITAMPANQKILGDSQPCCILHIEGVLTEKAIGQELIDETFLAKQPKEKILGIFLDMFGRPKYYYVREEKVILPKMPERIILQLSRFGSIHKAGEEAKRIKIDCNVEMSEKIEILGHPYRLKSVVVHDSKEAANGHYYAMVKKEDQWWHASDEAISAALPLHVDEALSKGYLYFYEKINSILE